MDAAPPPSDEKVPDEALMRRYLSGDTAAFELLYRRHSPKVLAYFRRKLPRRAEADELHQSVFLKFHRLRRRYDPRYPVLQWLFVIARTTLVDFYRKEGRRVPEAEGVTVEDVADRTPAAETGDPSQTPSLPSLDRLTEGLTPEQRKVVELKFIDELTYDEISVRLGKSSESLRQIASRALRKLRRGTPEKGSA